MSSIELSDINNYICRNTHLSVRDGEFLVLVGATGAGKTTLLNVIAGLASYQGTVLFDNVSVDRLQPAKRNVGYLFQSFALFPHMTVKDNIAFGLKVRGTKKACIDKKVELLLKALHIHYLKSRYPKTLSGGEKQRVALARTLAPHPKILLLDEPFNSLDPRTTKFLLLELKNLQKQFGLTVVYVTHNQREAFEMGDRIAVVNRGRIEQVDKPVDILFSPKTTSVATLFGSPNIFECNRVEGLDFGLGKAICDTLPLIVPHDGTPIKKIAVLPSGVLISQHPPDKQTPNRFIGIIRAVRKKPPFVYIDIQINNKGLIAEVPQQFWDEAGLKISNSIHVCIPIKWVRVLHA